MKNIETKTLVEIEGVVINDEIIKALKELQDHDNECVDMNMDFISDAICYISKLFHELDNEELKEAAIMICNLTATRNLIRKFRKP